jgi:hypothetical protein
MLNLSFGLLAAIQVHVDSMQVDTQAVIQVDILVCRDGIAAITVILWVID